MPIISRVGRKTPKIRILNFLIHFVLILGAVTMIFPFLMMISTSFSSSVDSKQFSLYPKFWFDKDLQFRKYVAVRYNEESAQMISQYKNLYRSFDEIDLTQSISKQFYQDWCEFIKNADLDEYDYFISQQSGRGIYPLNDRKFREILKKESGGEIDVFNQKYGFEIQSWEEIISEEKNILSRNFSIGNSRFAKRYQQFKQDHNWQQKVFASVDGYFITNLLKQVYKDDLKFLNEELNTDYKSWSQITIPGKLPENKLQPLWKNFAKYQLNISQISVSKEAKPEWQKHLKDKYLIISTLNEAWNSNFNNFFEIDFPNSAKVTGAEKLDFTSFLESKVNPENLILNSVENQFRAFLENKYKTIAALNNAWQPGYRSFSEIRLPTEFSEKNLSLIADRNEFLRQKNILQNYVNLSPAAAKPYRNFLLEIFESKKNAVEEINYISTHYFDSLNEIIPSKQIPPHEAEAAIWQKFVLDSAHPALIRIDENAEIEWQNFLKNKYGNIEELNLNFKLIPQNFDEVAVDYEQIDAEIFRENRTNIVKELNKRNYVMVLDTMLYNGRAILNTLIYVSLAIATALFVNPLAAYAMSRFKLKSTYKILLFLILTMAFPPMVMGIPNFLLLKKLNLLNTFLALILPAAADGYFIFLLKGFFDSLPQQLFESATIDGAGEFRIFWKIAMPLSKPIMAVIALSAFNAAYRNFMFAFIVCQDKSMWTMMVNIYQLMQRASNGVGYAALVIASIPTLLVFIFFQNIIIRGIVVPQEK
ncbi:MAG: ABC transporter permease subunit [Candidatus Cloacimonetes bacterium]|nr:ABC transporter permease subunit [Candidatus Cloacimonadota bacterium]MCF7815144.1 ABC transporter permease subunit [Candidatus Cloacimonadota bacterium]MCF7869224.1 ABC transporter permease subunit [Candidatus Cloacimonadota bacterium]MCF7884763.1 ABC transporter permease subunit [Candidatus Cloacimonadota bacterium]